MAEKRKRLTDVNVAKLAPTTREYTVLSRLTRHSIGNRRNFDDHHGRIGVGAA